MQWFLFFCSILLLVPHSIHSASSASTTSGLVELDEYTFDKITNKFEVSLIKFDIAFPYGDKHDSFLAVAKEAKDVDDLLIAAVGVKDYGEKDNEALAKKYGATKDNFPVIKLFIKGKSEPLNFDTVKDFTSDDLRRFIRENTGLYLSLPGCVKELDKLAREFVTSNKDDKNKIIKKTDELQDKLSEKKQTNGKVYKAIMEKILEKGDDFVKSENIRLKKILNSKITNEKKKEITIRINILQSFQVFDKKENTEKAEL